MQTFLYILCSCLLYTILWYKGNAKILFGFEWPPWKWWLFTGLFTNYLGLVAWWFFVTKYNIWGGIAITYILHTIIELGLSFYYFDLPTTKQITGLTLLILGGFLVLK
tara:strand:+ start:98 stop:421 length:324 start_codon:yes stop_codon:yes gene_type:complete